MKTEELIVVIVLCLCAVALCVDIVRDFVDSRRIRKYGPTTALPEEEEK